MSIVTEIVCEYGCRCPGFVMEGTVSQAQITDEALQSGWAVWPDGTGMCPECCKTHDTTDCADAWALEAYLAGDGRPYVAGMQFR